MVKIILPESDDDLLKECRVEAFRASGPGGQHVNVTDSAIRLVHLPSGLIVTSQKERSQYLNKKECLKKLRKRVVEVNYVKPTRISTKTPYSVRIANKVKKSKQSQKKKLRKLLKAEEGD